MRIPLAICDPHSPEQVIRVEASIDKRVRTMSVPPEIVAELGLAGIAGIAYGETSAILSYHSCEACDEVVLGLVALTSLCLEIDPETGQLRKFTPLLLSAAAA